MVLPNTRHTSSAEAHLAEQYKLVAMPIKHPHAAGIDVGDSSHWVCVDHRPEQADSVREFPAHTCGLQELSAWLKEHQITTVALEASGVYGHVLFLQLIEDGFEVVMTGPHFTRQIKGRPKTDKRDCQWIQRLHTTRSLMFARLCITCLG